MRKSLKDYYQEGSLDSLPSMEEAKKLANELGRTVLCNTVWPAEKTGREKSFIVTADNFHKVVSAVIARPGEFPVRIPITYKIEEI